LTLGFNRFSSEEMQSLFDPVVKEITKLVGQQVKEAKSRQGAVIDVLLIQPICLDLLGKLILSSTSELFLLADLVSRRTSTKVSQNGARKMGRLR
jgi:hypothetical protein